MRVCILLLLLLNSIVSHASFLDNLSNNPLNTSLNNDSDSGVEEFLPHEQAFNLNAYVIDKQTIQFNWEMPKGYYLYKHTFKFTPDKNTPVKKVLLPDGVPKYDEYLGDYQVYFNNIKVPIYLDKNQNNVATVTVDYQGCASSGYCYPPMKQTYQFTMLDKTAVPIDEPAQTETANQKHYDNDPENILFDNPSYIYVALAFLGFGILLAFTPCVLPMLPILSGIIVGQQNTSKRHAFLLSLVYVVAVAITYAIAGVLAGLAGASFQALLQKPWILISTALLFIALAGALFGFYELKLPAFIDKHIQSANQKSKGGTLISVFLMGILSALVVSPCVTAPLVGALTYISQTGDAALGGLALFSLGIGMGVPLIVIVTLGAQLLPKSGAWMEVIKHLFGFMMLGLAIFMLTRLLDNVVNLALWGCLLLVFSLYAGTFTTPFTKKTAFLKITGIVSLVAAVLFFMNSWQSYSLQNHPKQISEQNHLNSVVVKTGAELEQELLLAKKQQQPVLLDITADWCLACQVMKRTIFAKNDVIAALKDFKVIEFDITDYSKEQQAVLKNLGVFAPPTFIFYDSEGEEIKAARIVSEVSKNEFLTKIKLIRQ